MENKATAVLDQRIVDIQQKITQTKVNIADVVIRTMDMDIRNIKSPKDMLPYVEDIDKMPQYLREVNVNENLLTALTQSRNDIENAYSTTLAQ
ncbi:unknown [Brachyspira sp. CAG:484]|nr:unknown [Brachyspira sp. CAG:484]